MTAALYFEICSLLLSQLPFSSSFVSVFVFCTFLSCSELFFFLPCIYNDNNKKKQGKSPFAIDESHHFTRQASRILQLLESRPYELSRSFLRPPFLKKGPPKITEGDPLGPLWLVSRINPVVTNTQNLRRTHVHV